MVALGLLHKPVAGQASWRLRDCCLLAIPETWHVCPPSTQHWANAVPGAMPAAAAIHPRPQPREIPWQLPRQAKPHKVMFVGVATFIQKSLDPGLRQQRWPDVGVILGQRLRRWPNTMPTSGGVLVYCPFISGSRIQSDVGLYLSNAERNIVPQMTRQMSSKYINLWLKCVLKIFRSAIFFMIKKFEDII